MKAIDIALKDMLRSFRTTVVLLFMFGLPLLITGMFYIMFGNLAQEGGFELPRIKVVVANLDEGGPRFQVSTKNMPAGVHANSMGELVAGILESEDMVDLLEVERVPDRLAALAAVDSQAAQVAIIIPADFSHQFADVDGKAIIEMYQDPTLTIGPGVVKTILGRFMDGMSGVKIALDVALRNGEAEDYALAGQVVQEYLEFSLVQEEDTAAVLLDARLPQGSKDNDNIMMNVIGPIMGGMMIFYAFYTGTVTAQSILKEEEERTLPRLFTTPTPQATILRGKFLAGFLTVVVQVSVLLVASHYIFGIDWGAVAPVALVGAGIVFTAASFGICINSFLKNTKQGGVVFGGVLTLSGMTGMLSVFTGNPTTSGVTGMVSLVVPQGWGVRGLLQAMNGEPMSAIVVTFLVMLAWSAVFFAVGVWRFNRRYT